MAATAINYRALANRTTPLNRGLLGWWLTLPRFRGSQLIDLLGQNHGVLTNGTTWGSAAGRSGGFGSMVFDGSDDFVDMPSFDASALTAFSCSFWLKTTDTDAVPFSWADFRFARIGATANKLSFSVDGGVTGSTVTASNVTDGLWHHIAYSSTASAQSLYFDAVSESTATETLNTANSGIIRLGAFTGGTRPMVGQMDDVRVYNRAISADEVRRLYNDSRAGYWETLNRVRRMPVDFVASGGAVKLIGSKFSLVGSGGLVA